MKTFFTKKTLFETLILFALLLNAVTVEAVFELGIIDPRAFQGSGFVILSTKLLYVLLGIGSIVAAVKEWRENSSSYQKILFSFYTFLSVVIAFLVFTILNDPRGGNLQDVQSVFGAPICAALGFLSAYTFMKKTAFLNAVLFLLVFLMAITTLYGAALYVAGSSS